MLSPRLAGTLPLAVASSLASALPATAAVDAKQPATLFRYPDISKDSIVFSYANDLWIVPKEGGVARPLASPPGAEAMPRFSPDGQSIAFVANYDAGRDLYVLPVTGGVPQRVTHHPTTEMLTDWTPDGGLIFATAELGGLGRQAQLFTVPASGGLPTRLPVPYGTNGAISADGTWLAYTPHSTDNRTWKRYRGGMATDIWLFNLKTGESRRATDWEGTDTLPMWHGDMLYYLSDEGGKDDTHRLNLWSYELASGKREQVTRFTDHDVKWPAISPEGPGKGEIVFQNGASLWRLDLATRTSNAVPISIPGDRPKLMPQVIDANGFIQGSSISPSGKRVAVQARGDLWSAPAENGTPRNLTRTSGIAERDPSWSPDGKWIAFFSDETGEYELFVMPADGKGERRKVTGDGTCFRTGITWSPDSKKAVVGDKTGSAYLVDLESGTSKFIDKDPWSISLAPFSWSPDSRWIAYARGSDAERSSRVYLHDTVEGKSHEVTSGMFNDASPTFDRKGDWLVFTSARSFNPKYSALDTTWIYDDAEVLVAVPLRKDFKVAWLPKSDEEGQKDEEKPASSGGDSPAPAAGGGTPAEGPPAGRRRRGAETAGDPAPFAVAFDDDDDDDDEEDKDGDEAPAGPAGTWKCTASGGPQPIDFTLSLTLAEDNSVKGSFSSPMASGELAGSWNPETKAISLSGSADGSDFSIEATIEGDAITGTATVRGGDAGEQKFTVTGSREGAATAKEGEKPAKDPKAPKETKIDLDGFELRAIRLPAPNGSFGTVAFNDKNHVVYGRGGSIRSIDLADRKREEKTICPGGRFGMSADGKKILTGTSIVDANPGATPKPIVTQPMLVEIDPRAEWKQMFREAWRLQRDYFYEPGMHGVDWPAVYERYAPMVELANGREDLSFLIAEMISELNIGHAYYSGGDVETTPSRSVGLLGVDWEVASGPDGKTAYRIGRIVGGAPWDLDARNPLRIQGLEVNEGDLVLAVNGVPFRTDRDPWAAFQGLAGKPVTLTVATGFDDAKPREVVVEPIASESDLRYRDWIESRRAMVEAASNGTIGYIYVPNTGVDGQTDLVRQYQGQLDRAGLIIDDRWNGGGQIPNRFIEMLNRPVTNYWARRDSNPWVNPSDAHQGPKAMLINGLAGSGGDMFPWLFRHFKLGPLVGTRTWGGLVGISGNPGLVDGGRVTVPTFGFYETDGTWGVEGHGVDPDVEVIDDPALMKDGADPQLAKAIELVLEAIRTRPFVPVPAPKGPDRSGMGIDPKDK
jgi:tricorn protease